MKEQFESRHVARMRRSQGYLILAGSTFLLTQVALFTAALTRNVAFFEMVPLALILGFCALAVVWRRNPKPRAEPTAVKANRDGVRVGSQFVPRRRIREAHVLPRQPSPIVRINQRGLGLSIEIVVKDEAEGRSLLHAMGLDASQTVARFRVKSRAVAHRGRLLSAHAIFILLGAAVCCLLREALDLDRAIVAVFGLAAFSLAGFALAPSRLDVGADGILIRWLGRRRFIDYGDVEVVSRFDEGFGNWRIGGVDLLLASGESVRVPVGSPRGDDGRIAIVEQRIKEAMDTHAQGRADAAAPALERGSRAVADWVVALRSIGAGANAAHRIAPVEGDRLWRILEDASAGNAARAAAAVALGPTLDDDGRARVAMAAEATAAPRLRVVLDAVATEEADAMLEALLGEVDAEAGRGRAV